MDRLVIVLTIAALVFLSIGCAEKKMPAKYKHIDFYSEERVIVQTTDKYFINDTPKGEVKQ
jgi:hypothetical protein